VQRFDENFLMDNGRIRTESPTHSTESSVHSTSSGNWIVAGFTAGIVLAGTPTLAHHGGDHRPRPGTPAESPGLYRSGQVEYPDGPTGPPLFTCPSADNRPEQAAFPDTGRGNVSDSFENNNPND
jgi:hypothetical protein